MNIISRKLPSFIQKEKVKINSLGRWIVFILTNGIKNILVIIVHRILEETNSGLCLPIS